MDILNVSVLTYKFMVSQILILILYAPTPQNGQTHSNNSSATADGCLNVFDHFVGLAFKGLTFMVLPSNFSVFFSQKCL